MHSVKGCPTKAHFCLLKSVLRHLSSDNMPGIVGIISRTPGDNFAPMVQSMISSMQHEPFYVSGTYSVPLMGVYAGWVAHEHSFASDQVFFNERKDVALVFSGECFANRETVTDLQGKGHAIEGNNGWLVHLYEEKGHQFVESLNGLFSGLLIDTTQRKAFLFNDRYGVQRIYWHESDEALYFSSEAKALLHVLPELRAFDLDGVNQFLTVGCTMEGRTLFNGMGLLPSASLWSFADGQWRKQIYFSPETWDEQPTLSLEEFQVQLQETFKRVLPRFFQADSQIGISLTGGLDSRMIMACLPPMARQPVCYTFGGIAGETRDVRVARRVAKTCGLEHKVLRIRPDFFSDFEYHVERTVYITDGCLGALGAHEIYLNAAARELAPTRITGNYGSEVLRGVSTFKPLGLSPCLTKGESANDRDKIRYVGHPITFAAFREIPWRRFGVQMAGASQVCFRTPYLDNEVVALAYRAPRNAGKSSEPAAGLIKSNNLALGRIPTDMGELGDLRGIAPKLRKIVSKVTFKLDYLNNEGFPDRLFFVESIFHLLSAQPWVLGQHKHLHYRSWFRRELAGYMRDAVTDPQTKRIGFWNSDFLETLAADHVAGRKNYVNEINAVLTLGAVDRLLFQQPNRPNSSGTYCLAESALVN
jgi:asparagine synthase (glutamine-hydrolysing)